MAGIVPKQAGCGRQEGRYARSVAPVMIPRHSQIESDLRRELAAASAARGIGCLWVFRFAPTHSVEFMPLLRRSR
jgi:hypothetical protein